MDNTQRITLDIRDNQTYEQFYTKQYNKGFSLEFEVTKDGESFDLSGCTASFEMKKPDKTVIWSSCNMADNILSIAVDDQMTVVDGKAEFQITLMQGDTLITTVTGVMKIEKSVIQDSDIESSDQFSIVADILVQIGETKQAAIDAKGYMESASTSATNAAISETNAKTSETNAKTSETNAKTSEVNAKTSETNSLASATSAQASESNAASSASIAQSSATTATEQSTNALEYANLSQSYAVGNNNYRDGDTSDNAKYYYEQCKAVSESLSGALRPMGTVAYAELPALNEAIEGDMYNISDEFVTTTEFKEGEGITKPTGSNIYKTADGYWDVLAGSNPKASSITYNNTDSELVSDNVQGAIDEVCENYQSKTVNVITSEIGEITKLTGTGIDYPIKDIAYGDGFYVGVCDEGYTYTSTDGINWIKLAVASFNFKAIAYGNGAFLAVGDGGAFYSNKLYIIDEGVTRNWSTTGNSLNNILDVVYGNDKFVVVALDGTTSYYDGSDWIVGNSTHACTQYSSLAYGKGIYVNVNDNGYIYYSNNGVDWTESNFRTIYPDVELQDVAYGNGIFITAGIGNNAYYSYNGIDWIEPNSKPYNIIKITYGNNMFIGFDDMGSIYYSIDGIDWDEYSFSMGYPDYIGATYGDKKFIASDSGGEIYHIDFTKEPQNLEETINDFQDNDKALEEKIDDANYEINVLKSGLGGWKFKRIEGNFLSETGYAYLSIADFIGYTTTDFFVIGAELLNPNGGWYSMGTIEGTNVVKVGGGIRIYNSNDNTSLYGQPVRILIAYL